MIKKMTLITLGLILLLAVGFIPMEYPETAWLAGIMLLALAYGCWKKGWVSPSKDYNKLFTMNGIGTYLAFLTLIIFGIKLLETTIQSLIAGMPVEGILHDIRYVHGVYAALVIILLGGFGGER